jgi:putative ABC transport system permease protein
MYLIRSMFEAIESLNANKLRSALTMLGIVIGVAAVVAMLAVGAGAQNSITSQINNIGTNLLYVFQERDVTNPAPLTLADAKAIADPNLAHSVIKVAPVVNVQAEVSIPGKSTSTSLVGVTPEFFQVQKVDLAEGLMITQANLDNYSSVVLLGYDVANNLFEASTGLIGKSVRISGQVFKVIGVLKQQGGTGFGSNDNRILTPLTTTQLRLVNRNQPDQIDQIYVQAASAETVQTATDEVTQIMRSRHPRTDGQDDFRVLSTQSFLDLATTVTGTLTVFLGGIAGISLLVGGIGIMNIMLVSVTERTREIGLRKAVGARKRDIRIQFLVESLLLSLTGGIVGVLVGWGIATVVGRIASAGGNSLNPTVQLNSVLLATTFSAAVGVFFGLYPANRAAGLEPVEALRSE